MKLKVFDLFDMLDDISQEKVSEIMKEVTPYCLYTSAEAGMGICLIEQKENILSVIRKHAEELGLKVRVQGNFVNLDTALINDNIDWDDIWVGGTLVDSRDFWKEVVAIVKPCEERLIKAENFAVEWERVKKEALKNVIEKYFEQKRKELEKEKAQMLKDWAKLEEVILF